MTGDGTAGNGEGATGNDKRPTDEPQACNLKPEAALSWSVRPCAANPVLGVSVAVLVLALSFAVQLYFGGVWWGALSLVILTLAVLPYYVTTHYELDEAGAVVRGVFATYRRPWSEIRSFFPAADGVLLSPLEKPSRLALTRGLLLRFAGNRDEVLQRVEALVGRPARSDPDPGPEARADGRGTP